MNFPAEDLHAEIAAAVTAIVGAVPAGGRGDHDCLLQKLLAETGFHRLGVLEKVAGSGGTLSDLAVVVDLLAYYASRVPVGEEAFVAGWLLACAKLPLPQGITVAGMNTATGVRSGSTLRVSGVIDLPWGRYAEAAAVLVRCDEHDWRVALLPVDGTALIRRENLAGEPRDTLHVRDLVVNGMNHAPSGGVDDDALLRRAALLRTVQLAGAARSALDQTLRYVSERVQFGKPLAKFQAVQQQVASMAGEVAMMTMAAASAVLATEASESDPSAIREAAFAVAAAKATTSSSAHAVSAIAHQLHGAIGYSEEHALGATTSRLWSWREECGNEEAWHAWIGAAVRTGGHPWWSSIAGVATGPGEDVDVDPGGAA